MEHVLFGTQEIKLGDSNGRTRDVTAESGLRNRRGAAADLAVEWSELGDGSWICTLCGIEGYQGWAVL